MKLQVHQSCMLNESDTTEAMIYRNGTTKEFCHSLYCIILPILFLLIPIMVNGQSQSGVDLWPPTSPTSKPWTRWWWMGSAVDRENIRNLLIEYQEQGIGGLEIAPIYGAKGFESRYIPYLSPQWGDMLSFTVEIADSLGMQVDLTQGTGWPYGGPWVGPSDAASRLIWRTYQLPAWGKIEGPLTPEDPRQKEARWHAVFGRPEGGAWQDLSTNMNGLHLDWQAHDQPWEVMVFFDGKTGQKVKRAAPGGEGWVLDHLSASAVDSYLAVYDSAFASGLPGFRALYNDSYEVYGANWTPRFPEEFKQRRGYDVTPYLPMIFSNEHSETIMRVKSDYRETLHELLLEHFTQQWTGWANQRGKLSKNQAHGSPGNLLDLYGAVDIPECETFGSTHFPIPGLRRDSNDIRNVDPDPVMLKFASSAAHVTGKNLVSCETFTWLGEHFKSSFSQMKPELDQVFISGVNHIFYHGVTYSPVDVPWPGWLFYASLNLTPANSIWPHFRDFNQYVNRCQSMLQQGWSDNELLLYWPVYDVWADEGDVLHMLSVHNIDEWLHPTAFYHWTRTLMDQGYLMDFISDQQIQNTHSVDGKLKTSTRNSVYKTLIVPTCKYFQVSTLEKLFSLASEGGKIVFQSEPSEVPGLHGKVGRQHKLKALWTQLKFETIGSEDSKVRVAKWGKGAIILSEDIGEGLQFLQLMPEEIGESGLGFVRRKTEAGVHYFLSNQMAQAVDKELYFNATGSQAVLMDPLTGRQGKVSHEQNEGRSSVRIQLQPGESIFVRFLDNGDDGHINWEYLENTSSVMELSGPWNITFTRGGPEMPGSSTLYDLKPWHELDDERAGFFSGSAVYETSFELEKSGNFILQLGDVRESARIWVNGQEVGYVWSLPFQVDLSGFVKAGINSLKIEVVNLMANRIRYLDKKGISWRNYHEINFVNIDYQSFDASGWDPVPSGLLGPVRLLRYD